MSVAGVLIVARGLIVAGILGLSVTAVLGIPGILIHPGVGIGATALTVAAVLVHCGVGGVPGILTVARIGIHAGILTGGRIVGIVLSGTALPGKCCLIVKSKRIVFVVVVHFSLRFEDSVSHRTSINKIKNK